jgi:hypothetical protein
MRSPAPLWDKTSRLGRFPEDLGVNRTIATLPPTALYGSASISAQLPTELPRDDACTGAMGKQPPCPKGRAALQINFDTGHTKPVSRAVRMGFMRALRFVPEFHPPMLTNANPRCVLAGSPARRVWGIRAAVHFAVDSRCCATIFQRGVHVDSLEVCATTGPPSYVWPRPRSGLA